MIYAVWLILAACLYFFENNTGTRVILISSLLFPLLPFLRSAVRNRKNPAKEEAPPDRTVSTFLRQEADETDGVRRYRPGDPVRRIHWKLSAKKGDLLVRDTQATEEAGEQKMRFPPAEKKDPSPRHFLLWSLSAVLLLCLLLLLLVPEARRGCMALCNRVFAASETVNAYAYTFFPVSEQQNVFPASLLLILMAAAAAALAVTRRNRLLLLSLAAVLTFFQVYFGLPFPAWISLPVYFLLALLLMKDPFSAGTLKKTAVLLLAVCAFCLVFLPGVDTATETASEKVRDHLSRISERLAGTVSEIPEGESETRHTHTRSLRTGDREAAADREYRLVTVEEEQISMPHWIDYVKIVLLLVLSAALLILPFVPFLLLNARKRKAEAARKVFMSEDVSAAVRAIFQHTVTWLEAAGSGAGNRLYRDWPPELPAWMPEGYAARFSACAADFEEAVYSSHRLPEERREQALSLLNETERTLWQKADWKCRLRLKYWMCLCE